MELKHSNKETTTKKATVGLLRLVGLPCLLPAMMSERRREEAKTRDGEIQVEEKKVSEYL